MDYNTIISDFNRLIETNFNMQTLRELKKIYIYINRVYHQKLMKTNNNSQYEAEFQNYMTFVDETVFNKLKEKLDFEDEVIKRILNIIKVVDDIENIYIIDGNVVVTRNNHNVRTLTILPELSFVDITDDEFISGAENNKSLELILTSLNNAVSPFVYGEAEVEELICRLKGKVVYDIDGLNVFASRNMTSILADNTGMRITKVLAIYQNRLIYFDMKRNNNSIILLQNDYPVYGLSELLKKKKSEKSK